MISKQTKIEPSNKSLIVKHAKPTMDKFSDLSQAAQVAAMGFKHAKKVGKSFIPSVPVNYTCSKRQKAGKSLIPRFKLINSKQTKNGKPSLSRVNGVNLKKDKISVSHKPAKNRSYIPRRVAKKVEPLPCRIQEKAQRKTVEPKPTSLFGKSKIPVPISTKKANISNPTSHRRICTSIKKEDACASRFDVIQDDQVRVLTLNAVKRFEAQMQVLAFDAIKKDSSSHAPIPTSFRSLIPVRKLTGTLFKKRVSPLQPSTLTSVKKDELARISTFTSNEKANNLASTSLKNKHTRLQKSVNKPEASISITYNKVEITTTIYIIKPDISSVSLLCKAEKDLSSQHQIEEIRKDGK
jgi:hypothetical protein